MGKTSGKKIGIIGLGRMGKCLVNGMLEAGAFKKEQLFFTTKSEKSLKDGQKELGIVGVASNRELVEKCDVLILAVKPQTMATVLADLQSIVTEDHTLISIAASISTNQIEEKLGDNVNVVRSMPNTPAFVGEAITAVCRGKFALEKDLEIAESIFKCVGSVVEVEEKLMDAVTGLSGCGPAYIYLIMESLTDAGIKVGIPRELASQLAAQTVLGSAKMLLETKKHPAALRDEVTTPAGCTIDGLTELEEGKLRITLIKAVSQATKRAGELAKGAKI